MFKEIESLITERSVTIQASFKDGKINLLVAPRKLKEDESPAYWTPFVVSGTAEELDARLPEVLAGYVEMRQGVTRSLDDSLKLVEKQIKEAAEAAKKKSAERLKKPGVKAEPAAAEPEEAAEEAQVSLF